MLLQAQLHQGVLGQKTDEPKLGQLDPVLDGFFPQGFHNRAA
jgi:hypothetical protein